MSNSLHCHPEPVLRRRISGRSKRNFGPEILRGVPLRMTGCLLVLFVSGCSMLTPTALRCEYKNDPMGIDRNQPRFDWRLTTEMPQMRGQKQSAYQIMV